jgi:SWIM zinc finger
MSLTRAQIEALAPDQAALSAAAKLLKPGLWSTLGRDAAEGLIWGECQGSGANPYRVMGDLGDLGSKCTCPSRKFPCKHALALLWMRAESADKFSVGDVPEWVSEWLGRRRKSSGGPDARTETKLNGGASLSAALISETSAPPDAKADERKAAATEKRAAKTDQTVTIATLELDAWIADQLRTGIAGFLADLNARCRRIAARLVDGKAAGLASRVDELPARLLALPVDMRNDFALIELSRLVVISKAWRADPPNADLRREVITAETRDSVLNAPDTLRVDADWEVSGEQIRTRRDGLVSVATWLRRLNGADALPRFGLLIDFFPASAGKRTAAFASGDRFRAELAFYPSAAPLRALIAERQGEATGTATGLAETGNVLAPWHARLRLLPWEQMAPLVLPPGRLGVDASGRVWWQAGDGQTRLMLENAPPDFALSVALTQTFALWDGARLSLLAAETPLGRIAFDA